MKKKHLYLLTTCMGLFVAQDAFTNSSGSPSGHSGSPASNNNTCGRSGCHSTGSKTTETINISTNIPASGFLEDSVYSVTITANNGGTGTNRMGFMASVEGPAGHEGSITVSDASRTKKAGSYLTHTFSGLSGSNGQNIWSFDWNAGQAPDQSTVYVAVNFANNNGTTSGDVIVTESLTLSKGSGIGINEIKSIKYAAYPNPASQKLTVAGPDFEGPYTLYAADGSLVSSLELDSRDGQHYSFNVSHLKAGIYLLKDSQGHSLRFSKN